MRLKSGGLVLAMVLAVGLVGASGKETIHVDMKGYLGVTLISVENTHEGSEQNGLFVGKVFAGSGAEMAGLEVHDGIVAINGIDVANLDELQQAMGPAEVGDVVTVTIRRDDVESNVTITLGRQPAGHDKRFGVVLDEARAFIGVHVQDLGPQLAEYFEVEGGVLVTAVVEDGPAMKAGFQAGDVLLEIDGRPLASPGALHRLMGEIEKGQQLDVRLQRRGQPMSLFVEAEMRESHSRTLDLRMHDLHGIWQTEPTDATIEIVVPEGGVEGDVLIHEIRGEPHHHHGEDED